jgi:hypothetical protein
MFCRQSAIHIRIFIDEGLPILAQFAKTPALFDFISTSLFFIKATRGGINPALNTAFEFDTIEC